MKIGIYTLGCKVNQYETQAMEQELTARGHELVDFESPADAYIINTCSVTAVSDKKSRQMIRKLREEHPQALCAVCGCWSQLSPEDAAAIGADVVHGSGSKQAFVDDILRAFREHMPVTCVDNPFRRFDFEPLPAGAVISAVEANPLAIGYASLSAVGETVKMVTVGGVACSEETVKDGSYEVQRPFVFVTNKSVTLSEQAQAFFDFATSADAADLIRTAGAVPVNE